MVFTDGKYGYYHVKIWYFHIEAVYLYIDLGDNTKALENLKAAADHCIAFDNDYVGHHKLYTSPLINKSFYGGLITDSKGNQSYQLLRKLDNMYFNVIRDTPEFKDICESLRKNAK